MEQKGTEPSSLPAESPCPKNPICGDEELDEETLNFVAALDVALGPLLPEVTKLQSHQDPPAHLMVNMKARLTELGLSVSDARKKLLQYNLYLKKKLAKAAQEKKALKEQRKEDVGAQPQGLPSPDLQRPKPAERVHRRSVRIQDSHLTSQGEDHPQPLNNLTLRKNTPKSTPAPKTHHQRAAAGPTPSPPVPPEVGAGCDD